MDVHLFNEQSALKVSHQKVLSIVEAVLDKEGKRCDEVSIHFVDTPTICKLHSDYFDDPSTTDCISFPMDSPDEEGYCILGEVFICAQTAADYAKKHKTSAYEEATLYLVHGILHLLGYDDIGEAEPAMREAEKRHMDYLRESRLTLADETQ